MGKGNFQLMAQDNKAFLGLFESLLHYGSEIPYFIPSVVVMEERIGEQILYHPIVVDGPFGI